MQYAIHFRGVFACWVFTLNEKNLRLGDRQMSLQNLSFILHSYLYTYTSWKILHRCSQPLKIAEVGPWSTQAASNLSLPHRFHVRFRYPAPPVYTLECFTKGMATYTDVVEPAHRITLSIVSSLDRSLHAMIAMSIFQHVYFALVPFTIKV